MSNKFLKKEVRAEPTGCIPELLAALKSLKAEDLVAGGTNLAPLPEELAQLSQQYLRMIQAAGG